MTNAGWYPDPAGGPQTYRYWDGHSWSAETTGDPHAPAPGRPGPGGGASSSPEPPTGLGGGGGYPQQPVQPQPPPRPPQQAQPPQAPPQGYGAFAPPPQGAPGYGAGGYGGYGQPPYGGPPGGSGGGSAKTVLLIVGAVVLILALGVGGFFGVRALTGDDETAAKDDESSEAADPTSGPTDDPTSEGPNDDTDTSVVPTKEQCKGGRPGNGKVSGGQLQGGGLAIAVPDGYTVEPTLASVFVFAKGVQAALKPIEESWISVYAVGGVSKDNGFESTSQAAEILTQCMTGSNDFYSAFTGRTDLENGPVTVDGKDAYQILTEVRIDDADVQAEGDLMRVVVVDTGDAETFGLYVAQVPLGDQAAADQEEQVVADLDVR